ncbi:MAG: hypothetical protein Rubg2KO_25210 [Rubricoccaceae bacterium]
MPDLLGSRRALLAFGIGLASSWLAAPAHAQLVNCNAPTVAVLGQDAVDDFDCVTISGNLFVRGSDFTDLAGLSELTSVDGDVSIEDSPALASLAGLEALAAIGGNLEIGSVGVGGNDALTTLDGLGGLTSVGGSVFIYDNLGLTTLDGLESLGAIGDGLFIGGNDALVTLDGLQGLTTVPGDLSVGVSIFRTDGTFDGDNPALASLEGLANLTSVGGALDIQRNISLESLDGLASLQTVGGDLSITQNDALVSVESLPSLASVEGTFRISLNPSLTSLDGLTSLASVRSLFLSSNPALASISALENLTTITDILAISNTALETLTGLEGLAAVGSATSGGISISDNPSLASLTGLENVALTGGLGLRGNPLLTSLSPLESLTTIGTGGLFLGDDGEGAPLFDGLVSLTGLESVTTLDGPVYLFGMDVLESVAGLENVTSIGGDLWFEGNPALASLDALSRVTSVGGFLIVRDNDVLLTLDGLEAVASAETGLFVEMNDTLVDCACGLRGLISGTPPMFTGTPFAGISTNDPIGLCTSPEVVLAVPLSSCAVPLNAAPTADAGPDQSVSVGQTVTLDATNSSDPDDDPLTYAWTLETPTGSEATLSDPTLASPAFTADVAGDYTATLVVNDGTIDSVPDTATVTAQTVIRIVGCTPEAPLLFSDWAVEPGEDPRGEYVELTNDAGDATSVSLVGCSFLVFDPFTEDITYAAPLPASLLPSSRAYSFANTVVGEGQMIPPNTLPDRPSVFALVQGSASVGQSVSEVLASSSVVAAVVVDRDGTEFGSVRGGASSATNAQALLDAMAGLVAVAGEEGAGLDLELAVAPNPITAQGTVSFGLATGSNLDLALYDALGRRVARLAEGPHGPGRHTVPLDASALPPGVYVVRLLGATEAQTVRLTIAR